MPIAPNQYQTLRTFGKIALVANLVGTVAALALGAYEFFWARHAWGLMVLAGALLAFSLGMLLYAQVSFAHKAVNNTYRSYDALLELVENLRRQTAYARTISENSSLSEWAKRIIYREKDYEYLRDSIHSAIVRQDWDNVDRFINDLAEQFGMNEEALRLRDEVRRARQATTEEKIAAALKRFDGLCQQQKWDQAANESKRLKSLFPGDPRIEGLPQELELRRQQYKRTLLKQYDEAVRAENVDLAHQLLYELDHYLAPNEAAALKESARGVFRAKLLQMGVQFSLAVSDKHFRTAIDVGERIVREFPNSRYAQEIQGMMPVLRQRAAQEVGSVVTA